jgi:hypothetical protein
VGGAQTEGDRTVVRASYKPVTPDQRLRDLRKELKGFDKEEPGPERAARLAVFARAAHDERQLNMSMHAAQLCLEEDPDPPALLVAAYEDGSDDPEEQLRSYGDLQDLARYVDRPELATLAEERQATLARAWIREADDQERRYRLRTLTSLISRTFADDLRDELEAGR